MASVSFDSGAAWVWCAAATRPYDNVVCFRRGFDAAAPGVAELRITADTRYEVFVNGHWLGFGPARAWPATWPVDVYDLTGLLVPGRNAVAVLVQQFGIGTFQSIDAEPGLIADLTWQDAGVPRTLVTDAAWRCRPSDAHVWPVPRVSCMQPWEEQFDARAEAIGWTLSAFDDAAWPAAAVVRQAGEGAHERFVTRDIPMLTREPTPPVRLLNVEVVRAAPYVWSINPRDLLNPTDKTANFVRGRLLLATELVSDVAQPIQFHRPHPQVWTDWKLNGRSLKFDDLSLQQTDSGVAHATLRAGTNSLVGRLKDAAHYWWAVVSARTDAPITLRSPQGAASPTPWLALGPFGNAADRGPDVGGLSRICVDATHYPSGATAEAFDRIWDRGTLAPEDAAAPYARPVTHDMIAGDDVYARCASERVVPAAHLVVERPEALLFDTAEWTSIHPSADGDVRFLLDFGREVVGFHEFEIDAPAGTVVDFHNFEFIQPDGRFNLCEGMNNTVRYVCRDGMQRYRTLLRRGFRYAWMTLRRFDRPVRVRFVRVLMSTYPQARRGSFACSDPLLDRVWETGAHSVACCSEDAYTDCPTYEQTFWVGDGRNEALVDLVVNGDPRLSARSLRLAAQSLDRSPLVESQVPSGWQNILPAWSFLWMRWAQEHVELTGDLAFGREMVAAVRRNVAGIEQFISGRGLIKIEAWNMFDWAAMDTPSGGEVTHLNCLAVLGLRQTAELARTVDAADTGAAWDALADRLTTAIDRHLWDEPKRAYVDCVRPDGTRSPVFSQQTQTAAYISGVATGERAAACRAAMHAAPAGFVTAGSPFFMFFLLEGLVREGRFDELLATIRDYWGPQIEAGATTFWEMYHRGRPRMTRSHCHGWSAAPTYFLSRHVLGVSPAGAGFARVRVAPQPGTLRWARGAMPTPRGTVRIAWTQGPGNALDLRLTLPHDTPAEIVWPTTATPTVVSGVVAGRTNAGALLLHGGEVRLQSQSTDV